MAKLVAGLTVVLSLVIAGCGTVRYDPSHLANVIRDRLDQHPGYQVRSVRCPPHAAIETGVVITCKATLRGGHTLGVRATELNRKGAVHLVASEIFADKVERVITRALAAHGVTAKVVCPQHVVTMLERTFHCAARDAEGDRGVASVTIVSRDGSFRFRVRPAGR